jgi:hypothetical protein
VLAALVACAALPRRATSGSAYFTNAGSGLISTVAVSLDRPGNLSHSPTVE